MVHDEGPSSYLYSYKYYEYFVYQESFYIGYICRYAYRSSCQSNCSDLSSPFQMETQVTPG